MLTKSYIMKQIMKHLHTFLVGLFIFFFSFFVYTALTERALAAAPIGYTDHENPAGCIVAGWAMDDDSPSTPVYVHLYRGGQVGAGGIFVASTQANSPRGDSLPGYFFTLPAGFNDTYYVYAIGINASGTPDGQNPLLPLYIPNVPDRQLTCTNGNTIDSDENAQTRNFDSSLGFSVNLGAVEVVHTKGEFGIQGGSPDTAISTETIGGVVKTFFSCWDGTVQLSCLSENSSMSAFNNLSGLYKNTSGTQFQPVLGGAIPGDPFESQYAAIASTWRDPNTGTIHAWYHSEIPIPGCSVGYWGSIGHAISTDGGLSFTKQGRDVTSQYPIVSNLCYGQGAGEPKVLESGNYLYMIYDQGFNNTTNTSGAGLTLARALKTNPTVWLKYHNGGFTEPGIDGSSTPVIPHGQLGTQPWAGFVTWNSYLNKFVMTHTDYNSEGSVFLRISDDLISWSNPQLLFSDSSNHGYRYITQIGDSDDSMGQSGYLYFGRHHKQGGIGADTLLARRSISFQAIQIISPPGIPTGTPANGATNVDVDGVFTWQATGADCYDVYLGTNSVSMTKVISCTTSTSVTPNPPLDYSTTYYWKVVAINGGGNTSSPDWSFTTESAPTSTIYSASADFSSTQGFKNWYYRDGAGNLLNWNGSEWQGNETWLRVFAGAEHPGQNSDAVRRWTASQPGYITISGNARDGDPNCGDGVVASIKKGSMVLWQQTIGNGNTTGFNFNLLNVAINTGENIDFIVNKISYNDCDSTYFDPTINHTTTLPAGPIEVFADSFEISEWNGLWTEDSQNDWFRSAQRATSGTRSAEVDGLANNALVTSIPINLQGKSSAAITFSWFIESSLDTGEYIAFETSTDNGLTWVEKARISGNVSSENVWQNVSVNLTSINNLRIRFKGKMSDSTEDANVDNVIVIAQ